MCEAEKMKICQLLFFSLVLWEGAALIRAESVVSEGGNVTVGCQFYLGGSRKIFCKNDCNKEDILVETSGNSGRNGRYSIEYKDRSILDPDIMYVSITNVTKSDSGRYQCVLDRWGKDGNHEFRINVTHAATFLNPTFTLKPAGSPPSVSVNPTADSGLTSQTGDTASLIPMIPTQRDLNQSQVSFKTSEHQQHTTATPTASTSGGKSLYVGLTLAVVVIVLVAVLLIFCRNKRINKPQAPPVNTVYEQIPVADRLYEEIPEDNRQNGSCPVEISTVYTSASFTKPTEDQTSDLYSLAAAPTDQLQVENPSLTYSEVDFSESSDPSVTSAPQSQTEAVLYSVTQVQTEDSTVSLPQQ